MRLFDFLKKKDVKQPEENKGDSVPISSGDEILTVEERIRGMKPTCGGLYQHEVLVLSYAPKYYTEGNEFAGFWWYRYGVKDVQKILDSLSQRGYLQTGTIADAVAAEKLPAIKEELKKHGLKVTGRKNDLVQLLVENVPEDELSQFFSKRPYGLTERGKQVLADYEWIPYIHSHSIEDLNIWNLTAMVQTPPYTSYRDKIWGYLNQCGMKHIKERNYGLYRNSRFEMAEFLAEEGRYEDAFFRLCEVCAYDLSGTSNGFEIQYLGIYARNYFPYEKSIATVAPGIISRIKQYQDKLGWDSRILKGKMSTALNEVSLPFRLFTNEECLNIIIGEMNSDKDAVEKIYAAAEKRFRKKYKNSLDSQ